MILKEYLSDFFKLDPSADMIEFEKKWYSWGQIWNVISEINALLDDAGIGADNGIGLFLRNRPPQVAALLSTMVSDRCVMTMNPMQPIEKIKLDLLNERPPALVAEESDWQIEGMKETAEEIGCVGISITIDGAKYVPGLEKLGPGPHKELMPGVAIQMLTSGTTGPPKRIPLERSRFEDSLIGAMGLERDRSPDDPAKLRDGVSMLAAPLSHISGMFNVVNIVVAGRKMALSERFKVEEWLDHIKRHKPISASAVPTALKMILEANPPKEDLASLVALRSGTAPLAPEIVDEFLKRYDLPVLATYGATEFAGGVAAWTYKDFRKYWKEKWGSVGRFNSNIEGRVVDREDFHVLEPSEIGLLEIRGKQIGDGKNWVRTTDLASIDADGFLFIHGRADNAIIRGGFKIMPGEVVTVLEDHPAIREASVVGIKDERLGEVPVAALILAQGAEQPSEDELVAWVKERMTSYSVPTAWQFVDELPRTPSMKVSMPAVRELFAKSA